MKTKKIFKYKSIPFSHPRGGAIEKAFWRSAPLSRASASYFDFLSDAIQQIHVICLELEGQDDLKFCSNYSQRESYAFWKNSGFWKFRHKDTRTRCKARVRWVKQMYLSEMLADKMQD